MGSLGGAPRSKTGTSVPKGQLGWFNSAITVRGKAGLTWICTMRIDDAKAGPNEPTSLVSEGGR